MSTFPGSIRAGIVLPDPVVFKPSQIVPRQHTSAARPLAGGAVGHHYELRIGIDRVDAKLAGSSQNQLSRLVEGSLISLPE